MEILSHKRLVRKGFKRRPFDVKFKKHVAEAIQAGTLSPDEVIHPKKGRVSKALAIRWTVKYTGRSWREIEEYYRLPKSRLENNKTGTIAMQTLQGVVIVNEEEFLMSLKTRLSEMAAKLAEAEFDNQLLRSKKDILGSVQHPAL